jgi:hypothetical protein
MKETGVKFFFAPFCFASWILTFHAPCTYNLSLAAVSKCNMSVSWGDSDDKESGKVTKGERLPVHTTCVPYFFLIFPISLLLVIYLRTWRTARIPQLKPHCLSLRHTGQETETCLRLFAGTMGGRNIGVAVDFSSCSKAALRWASNNLTRNGDQLILIHVNNSSQNEQGAMHLWEQSGSRKFWWTSVVFLLYFGTHGIGS